MLRTGAILWADGKLDWDYTTLGNHLLDSAKKIAPHDFTLMTLPTELPARGERPPPIIRIGGNVQQSKLMRQPSPQYPVEARENRIQGTVRLETLIGVDGRIVGLRVMSGPDALVDSALAAVRQWQYQPTLLNGKPCYVVTFIDVNYRLGR
jgi:TonB family protein